MRALLLFSSSACWAAASTSDGLVTQGVSSLSMLQVGLDVLPSENRKPPNNECDWKFVGQTPYSIDDDELGAVSEKIGAFRGDMWLCNTSKERTVLVGPMKSRVQEWHTVKFDFTWLQKGDRIKSYTGDAVNASDASTPVNFPPLHMHHIHVGLGTVQHWWETHGDYLPTKDAKRGYTWNLPVGTCMITPDFTPHVFAHVNDVRFADGNNCGGSDALNKSKLLELRQHNPTFSWYFRIKFELAQPEEKLVELKKLDLTQFFDAHSYHDSAGLMRYDAGSAASIMFWELEMPHSGKVLPAAVRFHSHRGRFGGYLLVRGSHSLEGLGGIPQCVDTRCDSLANARKVLMDAAGDELLCFDHPEVSSFVDVHEKGGSMGRFDRQGYVECKPFEFKKGEIVTVFSFQKVLWQKKKKTFPQHTVLFLNYKPAEDEKAGHEIPVVDVGALGWAKWELGADNVTYWKVNTECDRNVEFGVIFKNGTEHFPLAPSKADRKLGAKITCADVSVKGVGNDQEGCNGVFHATNQTVHGAAVYKRGARLWYWSSTFGGQWQCDTDTDEMYKNAYVSTASVDLKFPEGHTKSAFWSLKNRWKSTDVMIQCVPVANPMWRHIGDGCHDLLKAEVQYSMRNIYTA